MSDNTTVDCFVCRKHRGDVAPTGGVLFENDLLYISHAQLWGDEKDHYLGHVFVEPKRHVPEVADLTEAEAKAIGRYPGAPREYWGLKVDEWPAAPRGGATEIEQVAARLRAYLREIG